MELLDVEDSSNDLIMWFAGREWALSWDLLQSFWRYSLIGIRFVIASILSEGKVQKISSIHVTAQNCIFLSSLIGYNSGALL